MSTILKALRRLEEERELEAPELRDQVLAQPRSEPRPRVPLLITAGAIGAVLVVGGFLYVDDRFPMGEGAASLAAAPVAEVTARVAASPPAARPDGEAEAVVRRPEFREPPRPAPRTARPPAPSPTSRPTPRPPNPAAPALRAPVAVTPAPIAVAMAPPAPAPKPAPVSAPPPVAVAEPAPVERPGIVGQPEVARRAPLPQIVVERTLWHPQAGRRLVVLQVEGRSDSVRLREGDALGDAVVQQIDPSAVVFLQRGVEIRRRVGAAD